MSSKISLIKVDKNRIKEIIKIFISLVKNLRKLKRRLSKLLDYYQIISDPIEPDRPKEPNKFNSPTKSNRLKESISSKEPNTTTVSIITHPYSVTLQLSNL